MVRKRIKRKTSFQVLKVNRRELNSTASVKPFSKFLAATAHVPRWAFDIDDLKAEA